MKIIMTPAELRGSKINFEVLHIIQKNNNRNQLHFENNSFSFIIIYYNCSNLLYLT